MNINKTTSNITLESKKYYPKAMTTSPTILLGVKGAASTITNSVAVTSSTTTVLNPIFTYLGQDVKQADWNGTIYANTYPDRLYVKNTALTPLGYGNLNVEFMFDGLEFEIYEKGTNFKYRIQVDEGYGYEFVTDYTGKAGVSADGGLYYRKVTFADRKNRRIKYEVYNGFFGGIRIGPNDTVWKIKDEKKYTIAFMGDSFTEGTGADWAFNGCMPLVGNYLNMRVIQSGVGGTGFINPATGSKVKFQDRVQHDIIQYSPDIVVIAGGTNDTTYTSEARITAIELLVDTIRQSLPKVKIILLSNWGVQNPLAASITNTRNDIKTVAISKKIPFIDSMNGEIYVNGELLETTTQWITGAGNIGATQAIGNASYYVYTDAAHPSVNGHFYIAQRLYDTIVKVI